MSDKKSSEKRETRARAWTFIIYPDSAPDNWSELLDEQYIEWVESPLHDKDKNGDGSEKKAHKHILLLFGGVKSFEQVKELTDQCNAPIPQRCHNARAMIRYMAHLDNPDKASYDAAKIISHGGIDLAEFLRPSSSERYNLIGDMLQFIKTNNILEFQDLMDYALQEKFDTWFPLLCDNSAVVVCNYIKSQRHRCK